MGNNNCEPNNPDANWYALMKSNPFADFWCTTGGCNNCIEIGAIYSAFSPIDPQLQ